MNGFNFPNIFKGNATDVITGKEAIIEQLSLLFNSELFEFRYDPGYGSNVPLLRFKPDTQLTRDLLTDAIYDSLMFCPSITFTRSQIQISKKEPGVYTVDVPIYMIDADYRIDIQLLVQGDLS